jgi:hypothetical protein
MNIEETKLSLLPYRKADFCFFNFHILPWYETVLNSSGFQNYLLYRNCCGSFVLPVIENERARWVESLSPPKSQVRFYTKIALLKTAEAESYATLAWSK